MNDIARLLGGRSGETERAKVVTHLRTCRRCREVYWDSAAEIGFVKAGGAFSVGADDLTERGMQVPAQVDAANKARRSTAARTSERGFWGRWRFPAVAAASVVVVAAIGLQTGRMLQQSRLSQAAPEILQPIRTAVGDFSRAGEIVLPGGEAYIGQSGPVFRSLNGGADESLARSLKRLLEEFLAGSRSPDVAYWLVAGYLSSNNIRTASIYAAAARERFPDDPRLNVLDAVVGYFDRDYVRSERLLRDVVKSRTSDPLAAVAQVNLAIVLRDQGKGSEAREILRAVAQRHEGDPIGKRAREVGMTLEG